MNYLLFSNNNNKKKKGRRRKKENAIDLGFPGFDLKIMVITIRGSSWLASVAHRLQIRRDYLLA